MVVALPAVLLGFFGLLIGSFLNVAIFRVPAGRSVVSPPSACAGCGALIKGYDNVPVISWLVLRGRCRNCKSTISVRYPLVEFGTAVFFGVVAWKFLPGFGASARPLSVPEVIAAILALVAFLYLAAVSVVLALIDLDTRTLPNRIVMPSYLVGAGLLGAAGIVGGDFGALLRAGIGMAALWFAYLLMALAYPGGMGFGDVKLAGVLGLFLGYLGWNQLVVGAFAAFLLGGVFSLALLIARKVNRKSGIPFGPWMLGGAWVGVLFGEPILRGYLAVFGLA